MPIIEALATLLGIIVAVLTIMRTLASEKRTEGQIQGTVSRTNSPAAPHLTLSPLPLTRADFEQLLAKMPVEWVAYEGMTPPLKLKIRGTTDVLYRYLLRKKIDGIGEDAYKLMNLEQQSAATRAVSAELYVLDWEGAQYVNGNAIPFSASSLELMLQRDPDLEAFLSGQVKRISPS
jgi:hypothetical protein